VQNEAGEAHGQDLQALREKSEDAIEQLRASHQATIDGLKTDHEGELASQAQTFQKQLSSQSLELKATAEDLAKAKAAHSTSLQEVEALKVQLDETRQAAQVASQASAADRDADIARLTKELSNARDELSALNEALHATQESMQEMGRNHQIELEEAAKGRAEEVSKLRTTHDTEIQALVTDKASLLMKFSDLEGELLTARASAAPAEAIASPKRLSTPSIETVTKEELQLLHESHNLKINDLQAQHEKAMRALQEKVDAAQAKAGEAEQDLERKKMEIALLEQDQEESQDQITKYVKLFGFKSFLCSIFAMAVITGSGFF
jgi:conserved oligomeric Golgi complex subunit 6